MVRNYIIHFSAKILALDIGREGLLSGYIIKRCNTHFKMISNSVGIVSLAQNCSVEFAVLFCRPNKKHRLPTGSSHGSPSPPQDGSSIVCTNLFNFAGSESLMSFNESLYLTYKCDEAYSMYNTVWRIFISEIG